MIYVSCWEEMINVLFFFDVLIFKSVKDVYKYCFSLFLFCYKIIVMFIML